MRRRLATRRSPTSSDITARRIAGRRSQTTIPLLRRGQFIRAARTAIGVTQLELANLLNLHRPAVSAIEAGDRNLTLSEGILLARGLGCTIEQLEVGRW